MIYYFFVNNDKIGKINQVIDSINRIDDQETVLDVLRTLSISFDDDDSFDVNHFLSVGQTFMELEDQVEATLTVADENKENIIYQTNDFNYLSTAESVIVQGGDKEYRYIWYVK